MKGTRNKYMKAKELDKKFDRGENISEHLDLPKAMRPGRVQKRVNVDLPNWMVTSLDEEARRLGITRQSIIKVWLAERLKKAS
jgi:biotin operon repressor